ncbi:unnamed protein product [Nezara viridula]|uniref:Uncharacterized protein n=1 Tax=Nezara viridula TaxID=85310 RepID=A0A9P0H3D3_NEZVI|nr:unnamed protein product [Nezara viridula]
MLVSLDEDSVFNSFLSETKSLSTSIAGVAISSIIFLIEPAGTASANCSSVPYRSSWNGIGTGLERFANCSSPLLIDPAGTELELVWNDSPTVPPHSLSIQLERNWNWSGTIRQMFLPTLYRSSWNGIGTGLERFANCSSPLLIDPAGTELELVWNDSPTVPPHSLSIQLERNWNWSGTIRQLFLPTPYRSSWNGIGTGLERFANCSSPLLIDPAGTELELVWNDSPNVPPFLIEPASPLLTKAAVSIIFSRMASCGVSIKEEMEEKSDYLCKLSFQ